MIELLLELDFITDELELVVAMELDDEVATP